MWLKDISYEVVIKDSWGELHVFDSVWVFDLVWGFNRKIMAVKTI